MSNNSIDILNIALKRAIGMLLLLMVIIFGFFVVSNIFYVQEGSVGVQLRFGKIMGNDNYIINPGGPHIALPSPIDRVLIFPTTLQSVTLDNEFYYSINEDSYNRELLPGRDGSLITGDKNIVHGKWAIDYQIDIANLDKFAANTGSIEAASELIKSAVAQGVIRIVSQTSVDDFIKGNINNEAIKSIAQNNLDKANSGIVLKHVTSTTYEVPRELLAAFLFVNDSESTKATRIETAKKYREAKLNQIAGGAWQDIVNAINEYETGTKKKSLSDIFSQNRLSGDISRILNDAQNYRTTQVQGVKSGTERFNQLLAEYNANPNILKNCLLQDAIQELMSGGVKKYYLPNTKDKTIYIDLQELKE